MFYWIRFWMALSCFLSVSLLAEKNSRPSSLSLSKIPIGRSWQEKGDLSQISLAKPPLIVRNHLVILDPGHGGQDVGTQSISKPRYQEKSLNLVTAQFVRNYLQQFGYQVLMTREEDVFISLEKRAQMANQRCPSLFVSLHYNSAPSAEAKGIEVFFYDSKKEKERTLQSKHLAHSVLKHMLKHTKAKSRGVKQGNFLVIRETVMPAILVEGGFVTNEEELNHLKDPQYLKKLAWGVTCGIHDYLSKHQK
jgi:N-acetylmuramoyl-L-alanine amidase